MIYSPGSVCAYTFVANMSTLDGKYKLISTRTFAQALLDGIDFVTNLYTPAGLNSDAYAADYPNLQNSVVLELQTVGTTTPQTYYVPTALITGVPDPTVRAYPSIVLGIPLGAFDDETQWTTMIPQINDIVAAYTGEAAQTTILVSEDETEYLTRAEYAALDAKRQRNIAALQPWPVQKLAMQQDLINARALLKDYEAIIISLRQALASAGGGTTGS